MSPGGRPIRPPPPGLARALPFLRCPVCASPLHVEGDAVGCADGHTFDVARQGYVSLLRGDAHTGTADDAGMVAARQDFIDAGHHDRLTAHIAARAAAALREKAAGGCVVDAGAGTGVVLAEVVTRAPERTGVAVDLSKHALRRAARVHPRIGAVRADTWAGLPLGDEAADAVLCVFAPRNAAEFRRVLRPGGILVVATPTPRHLSEVVDRLGLVSVDRRKPERLAEQLGATFAEMDQDVHEEQWQLGHQSLEALVAMGPSARHIAPAAIGQRVRELPEPLPVTCSVRVSVHQLPWD